MNRLAERVKIDIGLEDQAINNSNLTGPYYSMSSYQRALAVLHDFESADTKATTIAFMQAQNAAALGAKAVTGATATLTTPTLITKAKVTLATVLATETVTINGLVFTADAAATVPATRHFSIAGDDTADAAALVSCINDATYGVPGLTATSAAAVVTLVSTEPGVTAITLAQSSTTFTFAQLQAQAYVELDASQLDDGFTHVAVKVTKTNATATGIVGATLLRYDARHTPTQVVGASAIK